MSELRFDGRTVIVTGAGRGIGVESTSVGIIRGTLRVGVTVAP